MCQVALIKTIPDEKIDEIKEGGNGNIRRKKNLSKLGRYRPSYAYKTALWYRSLTASFHPGASSKEILIPDVRITQQNQALLRSTLPFENTLNLCRSKGLLLSASRYGATWQAF